MSSSVEVTAVHGFAGLAQDWAPFSQIKNKINLWSWPLQAFASLEAGAEQLLRSSPSSGPQILVGYSLGSRLALHALQADPERWLGAILISTHLGLANVEERQLRLAHDESWAQKWESAPWLEVCEQWNSQTVFERSTPSFLRNEADFDRKKLGLALRGWSLGRQNDLREKTLKGQPRTLFLAGENDTKFFKLQKQFQAQAELTNAKHLHFSSVPGAGHRVPWDQPRPFSETLAQFIDSFKIMG